MFLWLNIWSMKHPPEPSISPSEPEKKQRIAEQGIRMVKDPSTPKIISLASVRDYLYAAGLDVDSEGFIVSDETGERVEPYAFDDDAFRAADGPSDDPFEAYYRPESEVDMFLIGAKQSVHLSDLHTVYFFNGEPHPVRDDSMNLKQALNRTGATFSNVVEWSDAVDLIRDSEEQTVEIHMDSEEPLSLTCLDCEYKGELDSWEEDDAGDLRCPECSCLWDGFNLEVCTSCQTQHRWENIVPEDGGGMYWEPSCPDCGAGQNFLHSEDHYSRMESETTERVVEDWQESRDSLSSELRKTETTANIDKAKEFDDY